MTEHKTELRERVEEIRNESWCVEPGCEYEGKRTVQGHCFHRLDDETDRYITRMERRAQGSLEWERTQAQGEDYVKRLESMYVCYLMNWQSALDQLVRLRAENAALKVLAAPTWPPADQTVRPGDDPGGPCE